MPRNVKTFQQKKVTDIFNTGIPVIIKLGYNGNLHTEFEGYITNINAGIPIELRCKNEMYKLKSGNVSISLANATLKKLLEKVAPGYIVKCPDMELHHEPTKELYLLRGDDS